MAEYRKGIENIPLRHPNTSKAAMVIVYDLRNNDNPIVEKKIDFADPEDRKWIGRITFWAMENHCSVETIAMVDAEAETKAMEDEG